MSAETAATVRLAYEYFGVVLLLATLGAGLGRLAGRRIAQAGALAFMAAAFVPLPGASAAAFLLGLTGALSAASLVLFGALLARALAISSRQSRIDARILAFAPPILALGLVLYPPVLGVGPYDPYRLGFHGLALPFMLILFLAYAWFRRARLVAVWLALAAFLALAEIHPSRNLWDQLIDPLAVIGCAALLIAGAVVSWRGRRAAA